MKIEKKIPLITTKANRYLPGANLGTEAAFSGKAAGISLGAKYYLTKPFKPNELISCIEDIFCKHPAEEKRAGNS